LQANHLAATGGTVLLADKSGKEIT
jgi:hypothetical protein